LGAAPGSWSLYVLRQFAEGRPGSHLVAIDLSPLSRQYDAGLFDGDNFHFIQGDMTDAANRDAILAQGPYHLVMSDAAPSTTGNRSVDTLRSMTLAEMAIEYAETALQNGGNFVVKVFQGGDTASLLRRIRGSFASAKAFKPQACRSNSFETYYLGLDKR
jgi:23S rRNA (uridine2552-2'-O)-methyltransferase